MLRSMKHDSTAGASSRLCSRQTLQPACSTFCYSAHLPLLANRLVSSVFLRQMEQRDGNAPPSRTNNFSSAATLALFLFVGVGTAGGAGDSRKRERVASNWRSLDAVGTGCRSCQFPVSLQRFGELEVTTATRLLGYNPLLRTLPVPTQCRQRRRRLLRPPSGVSFMWHQTWACFCLRFLYVLYKALQHLTLRPLAKRIHLKLP